MNTLFAVLSRLPLFLLHGLGWLCGWITLAASPAYRRQFVANARQAGYGFWQVVGAVGHSGRLLLELPRLWRGRPVPVCWQGAELIEQAQREAAGILFLTPHMGCFEITAQAYGRRYAASHGPITVLYRPSRKQWLRDLVDNARQRPGELEAVPTTLAGVKLLIKALKKGEAVGLLPDQVPPQGMGVWQPFFGRSAYTMTLSARLAQVAGTRVLLAWGERLSWGRGFCVHVRALEDVLDGQPLDADIEVAAGQINRAMEALIRQQPGQYLWGYARYKQPRQL
ncbi:MAG: Lipid A biosynthesis palmitoleoyltransferase [Paracidovorax wautersii]|uniref:Lipid A biosynthesis palmitoleoyltransferase n=1 Tax=Paracidovorax wautersii TaxID=1177982 RepID=A0A7V8FQC9_9BURK|nr:MAG: Lipid A biosynthesis palmitoleoyltransferase [Paracidovorax wautersii]